MPHHLIEEELLSERALKLNPLGLTKRRDIPLVKPIQHRSRYSTRTL
jgi:hypothetical protein